MTLREKLTMRRDQLNEWYNELDDMRKDPDLKERDRYCAIQVLANEAIQIIESQLNDVCDGCDGDGIHYNGNDPNGKKCDCRKGHAA
jgi:hypothetical protein